MQQTEKIRFSSSPGILLIFQLSLLKPELNYNVATECLLLFDYNCNCKSDENTTNIYDTIYDDVLGRPPCFGHVCCLHVYCGFCFKILSFYKTAILQITQISQKHWNSNKQINKLNEYWYLYLSLSLYVYIYIIYCIYGLNMTWLKRVITHYVVI